MVVSEKTFKAKGTDYVIYDDFGDDTQNASIWYNNYIKPIGFIYVIIVPT